MGPLGRTCRTASIWISFEGAIDVHFVYDSMCTKHGDRMVIPYNPQLPFCGGLTMCNVATVRPRSLILAKSLWEG